MTSYPLRWPTNQPRKTRYWRMPSRFHTKELRPGHTWLSKRPLDVQDAEIRLRLELARIGVSYFIITSNFQKHDPEPDDPGVCVYFRHQDHEIALPCDNYDSVAGNIAAIAAHLRATREIERHGVATTQQMLASFLAIEAPKTWRDILGFARDQPVTRQMIRDRVRSLARRHHPDMGGSAVTMAEINVAADQGTREIGV